MQLKLLYFLLYAATAFIAAYISPYLHLRGLSDTQIGFYIGLASLASAISPILFGGIADKRGSALPVFQYLCGLAGLLLFVFSSSLPAAGLGVLYIIISFIRVPCFTLLDGLTFRALESTQASLVTKTSHYEDYRIWGSIGFAVGCVAIGLLLSYFSCSSAYAHFLAGILYLFVTYLCCNLLVEKEHHQNVFANTKEKYASVWRLIKTRTIFFLFLSLSLFNFSGSIFDIFHGRYLEEMGLAQGWLGPFWAFAVFIEVFFIYSSKSFITYFGLKKIVIIGVFCMVLRLFCYASGASLPLLIFAQLAHGPMALALYVLPQKFLNSRVPAPLRNTMQGVFRALCFGIPQLFGPWVAGMISDGLKGEDLIGLQGSFWFASITSICGLVVFMFGFKEPRKNIISSQAFNSSRVELPHTS